MYNSDFFDGLRIGAQRSARQIAPLVLDTVRPKSVVDVGCGTGTWLSVFSESGVSQILGIDGDYVDQSQLEIPHEKFMAHDLNDPLRLDRRFDLVLSLEVAEHLPAASANEFVKSLTRLGPVIVFSAAIPGQEGTHHINEQWPDYWAAKFDARGYLVFDCLRPQLWSNPNVEPWYAQNMLLFVDRNHASSLPSLANSKPQRCFQDLAVVHPRIYRRNMWRQADMELARELAAAIPEGEHFVLIDQNQLVVATKPGGGRRAHAFPENNRGVYAGKLANDDDAIYELQKIERAGNRYVAIAWPAFWWLKHYSEFARYIREQYKTTCENERVIIFEREI